MEKKNITSNPSTAWGPAGKLVVIGEVFDRGWHLVQRIVEKLSIGSVVLYL